MVLGSRSDKLADRNESGPIAIHLSAYCLWIAWAEEGNGLRSLIIPSSVLQLDSMPTFIDESGNTGRIEKGGTNYFRLVAVWVPSNDVANVFREAVRQLRRSLELNPRYEFKFSNTHTHPKWRSQFYRLALEFPFQFVVVNIDKRESGWNQSRGSEQHWACATELAAILRPTYLSAEMERGGPLREPVVVDDNKDKDFLKIIMRQFHALKSGQNPATKLVGKVAFRDSASDEMLQLADMVCGATGAYIDDTRQDQWYPLIAGRDLQPFLLR